MQKNGQKQGIVKVFFARKGYGFIEDGEGNSYFIHFKNINIDDEYKILNKKQKVRFTVGHDERGRLRAENVTPEPPDSSWFNEYISSVNQREDGKG